MESLRPCPSVPIVMALLSEDLGLRGFRICETDHDTAIRLPCQFDLQSTWGFGVHESERDPAVFSVSEGSNGGGVRDVSPGDLEVPSPPFDLPVGVVQHLHGRDVGKREAS